MRTEDPVSVALFVLAGLVLAALLVLCGLRADSQRALHSAQQACRDRGGLVALLDGGEWRCVGMRPEGN